MIFQTLKAPGDSRESIILLKRATAARRIARYIIPRLPCSAFYDKKVTALLLLCYQSLDLASPLDATL